MRVVFGMERFMVVSLIFLPWQEGSSLIPQTMVYMAMSFLAFAKTMTVMCGLPLMMVG